MSIVARSLIFVPALLLLMLLNIALTPPASAGEVISFGTWGGGRYVIGENGAPLPTDLLDVSTCEWLEGQTLLDGHPEYGGLADAWKIVSPYYAQRLRQELISLRVCRTKAAIRPLVADSANGVSLRREGESVAAYRYERNLYISEPTFDGMVRSDQAAFLLHEVSHGLTTREFPDYYGRIRNFVRASVEASEGKRTREELLEVIRQNHINLPTEPELLRDLSESQESLIEKFHGSIEDERLRLWLRITRLEGLGWFLPNLGLREEESPRLFLESYWSYAILQNRADLVEKLLALGLSPNVLVNPQVLGVGLPSRLSVKTGDGPQSPLLLAASERDPQILRLLLANPRLVIETPDCQPSYPFAESYSAAERDPGDTPHMRAAEKVPCVRPLLFDLVPVASPEALRLLVHDPRFRPRVRTMTGNTLMIEAARQLDAERFRILLESPDVDLNAVGRFDGSVLHSPLSTAASLGKRDIVEALLADPRLDLRRERDRLQPVPYPGVESANRHGHPEIARLIEDAIRRKYPDDHP
jgi:hypothetical protein